MNILVTGGLGFIGSMFVKQRHDIGDNIVNLDCKTYAASHSNINLSTGTGKYTWVPGDINNRQLVTHVLHQHDIQAVVHFAAESHVDRSISNSDVFIKTNINGTHNLLECVKNHEHPVRFIHVSTDEVYGELTTDAPAFTESHPVSPNSPYSASKASSDMLVRSYHMTHGLDCCITRCSNNYGPNQHVEKLIPTMITRALAGEQLPVYGSGENIRDWIHVQDHCEAVSVVLDRGVSGEVYNIGGETELSNMQIVKKILRLTDRDDTLIEHVTDRAGHDWRYAMNITKIREQLGWQPRLSFDQGLQQLVETYK